VEVVEMINKSFLLGLVFGTAGATLFFQTKDKIKPFVFGSAERELAASGDSRIYYNNGSSIYYTSDLEKDNSSSNEKVEILKNIEDLKQQLAYMESMLQNSK
jgi:hypothetical protein